MKKKVLSTLLVMIMCMGLFPDIKVSATDQNMNNPKITDYTNNQFFIEKLGVLFDKLVNSQYNYFTTTGKTCGNSSCNECNASNVTKQHPTISSLNVDYSGNTWSCYGFAKWTFKYLYGKDATGVYDNPSSRGTNNTTTVVASTYNGNSAKEVIQQAKIGDILQSPRPHSMIFLKYDDNYFYVLHSNWKWSNEGNNIVKVSKFSYDKFSNITVYRANNYFDCIDGNSDLGTNNPIPVMPASTPMPDKTELELSTTTLAIDHINNPEANVAVHISGTFPDGGTLRVESGSAVTTDWFEYNGRNATLNIKTNWRLAENDEVITIFLLDANQTVLAKKSIYVYSTAQKYSVQFNANGGNNAPENLVKWKGLQTTIPYEIPKRNGYQFLGWSESQYAAEPDYECGDKYYDNVDTILYAVWEESSEIKFSDRNTDGITVYINGKKIDFDVEPISINNRTMVPMRKIFEELGAIVGWDNVCRTAFGYTEDNLIKISIDSNFMYKNNEEIALDSPAVAISGRTLVPARAIAESLDCKVEWIGDLQIVDITKDNIEYLDNRNELLIGWSDFIPMNYYDDNGTLVGFDVDLAEYVCSFWGWKSKFKEIPFEEWLNSVNNGTVDCFWNGITKTEERAEYMNFSNEYLETEFDYEDESGSFTSYEVYSVPFQKNDYQTVKLTNIALEIAKLNGTIEHLKYKYKLK